MMISDVSTMICTSITFLQWRGRVFPSLGEMMGIILNMWRHTREGLNLPLFWYVSTMMVWGSDGSWSYDRDIRTVLWVRLCPFMRYFILFIEYFGGWFHVGSWIEGCDHNEKKLFYLELAAWNLAHCWNQSRRVRLDLRGAS